MKTPELAVTAKGLTRKFGKFTAVDNIDFEVGAAQIYGFLGPNGAGKSTTIRMLCGIIAPTSGQGTVGGFDIKRESHKIKQNIGYMSQRFSLYADLSVEQNLNFYSGIYKIPRAKKKERMEFVIRMAGLIGREDVLTGDLSGGWKQRLALGCAILHEPKILFLDEPTAGVDPVSRRMFWDLIYDMKQKGVTVFVTTHYMDEAEHCDTLSLIAAGRIVATGSPRELKEQALKGRLFSVIANPLDKANDILQKEEGLLGAKIFGRTIHVESESENAAESITEALAGKGCAIESVEQIRPSLEDAFINIIEKQTRTEKERFADSGGDG